METVHGPESTYQGYMPMFPDDVSLPNEQDNMDAKDDRGSMTHHKASQGLINNNIELKRTHAENGISSPSDGFMEGPREPELWACPFYVHHGDDCYTGYKRISDLRQHLHRKHLRPPYCTTCGAAFKSMSALKAHTQDQDCQPRNTSPPGITMDQEVRMHRTRNSGRKTNTERWYEIWNILFPDSEAPPLSRIEIRASEFSMRVKGMVHKYQGSQMMRKFVESSSASDGSDSTRLEGMVGKLLQDFCSFVDSEDPIQ